MEEEQGMTEQQAEQMLREYAEQKQNQHSFFTNIIKTDDTTRVGNLTSEELGEPKIPLRSSKELELVCRDLIDNESWAEYFKKESEILTSTSLSKEGTLIQLSVTNTKQIADITKKEKKSNRGWFKKSD